MTNNNNFQAVVAGTGSYLPEKILTNQELEKTLNTSDAWITERTGIHERRIASEEESASVMAAKAGRKALEEGGVASEELDLIIVATSSPDVLFPSTACFVQKELHAFGSAAYDISAVCSGFIFGLSIAEQYLKTGRYKNILLIGSEVNSRIVDWSDRATCILFGDGAGAILLKRVEQETPLGILSTHIYSDGSLSDLICVPGGIGKTGINKQDIDNKNYFIKMSGNATFKVAVKRMTDVIREALEFNGLSMEKVGLLVPHQANQRIIRAVAERLNYPMEKVFMNIHKYGNTSAASIPIGIDEARRTSRIKPKETSVLGAVGAGLTWGSAVIKW
ncbi:MAG: ketoacyl-ACP synthase III [Nitrospina sp.]|jgi:3-oxoacyl-[acyl-carrier-protein] synthase III|nr:ketoacyl-ACP synthase III [Nitrospina sp.]MBT5349359.1 ketoacyl-ACP synthase III [Nitrospina sp.]MBT5632413.1 ketoacyl-ACP synthase III [Nitrospina sp.]